MQMHLNCDTVGAVMTKTTPTLALVLLAACADEPGGSTPETPETITRVALTFTPDGGGASVTAAFSDPDGDGGVSATADPITLATSTTYALTIAFLDELFEPPTDITDEIEAESEEHLILLYGDAVAGPATTSSSALLVHAYADAESDYGPQAVGEDLPVGLANTITTATAGTGVLSVMLRHLPQLGGQPQKTADLPERFAAGEAIVGDVDADVDFDVTVQ
jgi:hypothetical protein